MSKEVITKSGLAKALNSKTMLLMAAGSIIGPWALFTSVWYGSCGPATILSLAIIAVFCCFIGLVLGELVSYSPFAGGEINYGFKAFNADYAWWTAWWLLNPWIVMVPWMVIGIISILSYCFFPEVTFGFKIFLAVIAIVGICILNLFRNVISATFQNILTVSLFVTAISGTIVFLFSGKWDPSNFAPFFQSNIGSGGAIGWLSGTAILITIYFGFEVVPQMAEEGLYPRNQHFKVIIGSVLLAAGTYIVVAIGSIGMAPYEFLSKEPFAEMRIAKEILGYSWFVVPYAFIGGIFAVATSGNGFYIGSMRLLFAMGQQNFMPRILSRVNKHHQPWVANIFIAAIGLILLFALTESWLNDLFTIMAMGISVLYTMTCIAALKLASRNDKDWQKRPWKIPGGNITRVLALVSGILMVLGSIYAMTPGAWKMLIIYFMIGLVIYIIMKFRWAKYKDMQPWTPSQEWAEEYEKELRVIAADSGSMPAKTL